MAGIGFVLRKLANRDDLAGIFQGYLYAAIISSGPWLFTIICIGALVTIGSQFLYQAELINFRIIIIYNFAFSLVLSAPVFMIATRYLADLIYAEQVERATGMYLGALTVLFGAQGLIVVPFYYGYAELLPLERFGAVANYFLITGIWLGSVFVTALKDYQMVTRTFAFGMMLSLIATLFLAPVLGSAGMLLGFNAGLMVIFFSLSARVFAEYPDPPEKPFAFLGHFRRYWEIALSGLIYNLAIWVDKWIMWFSPERELHPNGLISSPDYDSAMFLAYLSVVPAMALFTFSIETRFYERYLRFYQDVNKHATYDRLAFDHAQIWDAMSNAARGLMVLQVTLTVVILMFAPQLLDLLGISFMQLGAFRFGVLGAMFHIFALFLMTVLSYFDVRRQTLSVAAFFLVSNALLSGLSLHLGVAWYGFGYAVSAILTFAFAYALATRHMLNLPYQTFIVRNASVE
ncbi:MAG: exopolysaccharide Pel transporter PelG [Gammaproteobacteria bacterium]|nr:exopolysaccharide Pel transporter PelG [Gammaproteobacteria bacterium]